METWLWMWNVIFKNISMISISIISIEGKLNVFMSIPDSKVHGDNMEPIWVLSAPDGPHVGPMNLAIRDFTDGKSPLVQVISWCSSKRHLAFTWTNAAQDHQHNAILAHLHLNKMAAISQMTFSNASSSIKNLQFVFKFQWSLFLRVQLTISEHWFRKWFGAK